MVQFKNNISSVHKKSDSLKYDAKPITNEFSKNITSGNHSSLVDQLQIAMIFTDISGKILKCNRKVASLLGLKKSTIVGQNIQSLFSNTSNDTFIGIFAEFSSDKDKKSARLSINFRKDHQTKYIDINVSKIHTNNSIEYCFLLNDITDNCETLKSINKKYIESTTRLKEIHHRVKNNLQLISSLLNLEYSRHKHDTSTAMEAILKESQNKIYSISLIHKNLYENSDFSSIETGKYIQQLFSYISKLYNTGNKNIHLEMSDQIKHLPLKQSISVGLLIDEIITNSFKHAFENLAEGKIKISFERQNEVVCLRISDNGIGISSINDYIKHNTFGIELIFTLVKQLQGRVKINNKTGTEYLIHFPILVEG